MRNCGLDFRILKDLVGTQYGDMSGVIQMDAHDSVSGLYELCAKNGISRDDYYLLGFGLSEFTIKGVGEHSKITCSVFLLEKNKYGNTFDEIKNKVKDGQNVDVVRKTFKIAYSELGQYIKRFDTLLLTQMGDYIKQINVLEEEDE